MVVIKHLLIVSFIVLLGFGLSKSIFELDRTIELTKRELSIDDVYTMPGENDDAPINNDDHKGIFPLDSSDYLGFFFSALAIAIAASGGIGGGGILVPIYIMVLGFSPRYAVPLSNFTILGSSITNMALNLSKRHPTANRPLVDWNLILVMEPLTIAGALVGSILNKILPEWLLVICLIIVLGISAQRTLDKGISTYNKETDAMKRKSNGSSLNDDKGSELSAIHDESEMESMEPLLSSSSRSKEDELKAIMKQEISTPWNKVQILIITLTVVMIMNMLKGGSSFASPIGLVCGTTGYWVWTGLIFVWIIGISLYVRDILIKEWKSKSRIGYVYIDGDVEWDEWSTIKYPCLCFFAGFVAGLFGVGGGIVKGPLMLEMGIHPLVAAASLAIMILFTSFAACTSYVTFGLLRFDYGIALFVLGLILTAAGQIYVTHLIKKHGRISYVTLSIGSVVALSAILMTVQSVLSIMSKKDKDEDGLSSLC